MAEEILIKYKVDTTEFAKAETSVEKVTASVDELGQTIKVAFTQKSLDEAVAKLNEQGMAVEALVLQYGTAQKAFKGASKELIDMAARGEEGTKKFKDLQKAAAELQDTIEDTRGSIKKMSSDTRLIDSVAQGMRGLAAAGSVVAGAMATFGNENEAVQKTLLKVQGAMATLQGVQELATLATEKGGIATQAYGAALQVVDRISKLTGASMAASWALATAGITIVIGAIVGLIYWLNSAEEETKGLTKEQQANAEKIDDLKLKYELATGAIDEYTAATKRLQKETTKSVEELNKKIGEEVNKAQTTIGQSVLNILEMYGIKVRNGEERRAAIRKKIEEKYAEDKKQIAEKSAIDQALIDAAEAKRQEEERKKRFEAEKKAYFEHMREIDQFVEKEMKEADAARRALSDSFLKRGDSFVGNPEKVDDMIKSYFFAGLTAEQMGQRIGEQLEKAQKAAELRGEIIYPTNIAKLPVPDNSKWIEQGKRDYDLRLKLQKDFNLTQKEIDEDFMASEFADFQKYEQWKRQELTKTAQQRKELEQGVYNAIATSLSSISTLSSSIFANQSAALEANKEKELRIVGDNAEARKKIEQKYAIESAKIARKKAQMEKAVALVQIAVDIAKAVTQITATASSLAAGVITAPLAGLAYAQLGIAIGAGIAQAAVISSQPLPEIPTFEKGGPVPIKQGLLHGRSHREGGVLINAQGGEYIWDIPTVKKHGDLIRAAHENRLEDLVLHKYVAPMFEKSLSGGVSAAAQYDDFMLRATIKQGHEKDRRNAEYIAEKVSTAVTTSMFNKNRYQ